MRRFFFLICSFLIFNTAFATENTLVVKEAPLTIADFNGSYRGLGPAEDSYFNIGEYILNISTKKIESELATGLRITKETINVSFQPMSKEDIAKILHDRTASKFIGFSTNGTHPYYLFRINKLNQQDAALFVFYAENSIMGKKVMKVYLGLSMLYFYSESQVKAGIFQEMIEPANGMIPMLSNGGKAPNE